MHGAITGSIFCGVELTKIIPFKAEHLECMDMRAHEKELVSGNNVMKSVEHGSIAVTGMIDGRIICCGGIVPLNNGNSEIWLIPSIYVSSVTVTFCRELRKWLFGMRESLGLQRMQTACLNDDLHNRWMKFLGFEKEGVMKKYSNGVDFAMWGKTWA